MQGFDVKRCNQCVRVSLAERIIMTVILWGAVVGIAAIVTASLLASHP